MKYSNNLINYLPPFLREISEYKILTDIENEFLNKVLEDINKIEKEVIIDKATSYGLQQYESIFNIANTTNDVEERRFNIKSKLVSQLPFNFEWLDKKLTSIVGDGNYSISLNRADFLLTIFISHIFQDIATNLNATLRQEIPANIVLVVNLFKSDDTEIYTGMFIHRGVKKTFLCND